MRAIQEANRDAGYDFFEADTMRFFASRLCPRTVEQGPGGVYFITSEQFRASNGYRATRRYTVRRFYPETRDIGSVGVFQAYATREAAHRAARRLAAGE
jgi:hypothetical protein